MINNYNYLDGSEYYFFKEDDSNRFKENEIIRVYTINFLWAASWTRIFL